MKYGVVLAIETGEGMGRAAKCGRRPEKAFEVECVDHRKRWCLQSGHRPPSYARKKYMLNLDYAPHTFSPKKAEPTRTRCFTFSTIGHWLLDDCPVYQIQG
jgi:hypothetical protein